MDRGPAKVVVVIIIIAIICCCTGGICAGAFIKSKGALKSQNTQSYDRADNSDRPERDKNDFGPGNMQGPQMDQMGPMQQNTSITLDEFKEIATSVSYDDLVNDSEKWDGKDIKIKTKVTGIKKTEPETIYICTLDGNEIYVSDERISEKTEINKGDDIIVYGKSARLYTEMSDQETKQIPLIKMFFSE